MNLHAQIPQKFALVITLALFMVGCGKQEETVTTPPTAASEPAFPTGNGDKVMVMTIADCDKLPDPKPTDDSAAGRATAVSQGVATRAACKKEVTALQDKPNADLARIRAIKEKEQADQADRKISEKEWGRRIKEGGSQPIRELKY